ncbi:MAG: type I secretion system permease/ATPase, partial [Pseudomonadota bacterium]
MTLRFDLDDQKDALLFMADHSVAESGVPREILKSTLDDSRRGFWTVFCISFVLNLLMLVSPIYMMQVFDRVLTSGRVETLIMLTLIAAVAIFVLGQLDTLRQRTLTRIGLWFDQRLAIPVLSSSIQRAHGTNEVSAEPMRDVSSLRGFLGGQGIIPFLDSPWVPFFVLIIFFLHPLLGVVALLGAVALFVLALVSEFATRAPTRQAGEKQLAAWSQAEGAVRNSEVVQAMGMMPSLLRRWSQHNNEALQKQLRASDRSAEISGYIKAIRIFVQVAILGLGAYLVIGGSLTAGGMIAASILLGRGLAPVEQSVGAWRNLQNARAAYQRIRDVLEHGEGESEKLRLTKPEGRLSVEAVTYEPKGTKRPIIDAVSFELDPGEAIAVVGPSASGKSTLCRLLVGVLSPTDGAVRLDGADVRSWPRNQFGEHVGYLPQMVSLFDGTVAENIARMADPDSDQVIEAAKRADVHDMVLRLADGYNTPVSEVGPLLSGGQRQR